MGKRIFAFIMLFVLSLSLEARNNGNVLEININSDDLEIELAKMKAWSRNSQTFLGVGFLKAYDDDDIENTMYYATLTQVGYTDLRGFSFGIGFRGIYGQLDKKVNL